MTGSPNKLVGRVVPVLLYHSVAERSLQGHEPFTVRPSAFADQVRAICESGRTALTLGELGAGLRGERSLPPRPVVITFDDGFANSLEAAESLLSAGLSATVFVTSGWVGTRQMLTSQAVRRLAQLGDRVEVGAHSVSHRRLDELGDEDVRREIVDSKSAVGQMIGGPVASFAYPHGAYDRRVCAAVKQAGFTAGAAVKNAISHDGDDPYAVARVTIGARTTTAGVESLLGGSGAPVAWRKERPRTRGYRVWRRARRGLGRPVS